MLSRLWFYRSWLLSDRRRLGRWGERTARVMLERKGLRFLCKNYRCRGGEIDLVFRGKGGVLVFVEVKTRQDESFAPGQASVGVKKRKRILKAARHFRRRYDVEDQPRRFDVVAVVLPRKGEQQIRHYKGAFSG